MKLNNYNTEPITKEVAEELEKLQFVQKPNFLKYDYVSISETGEFLELETEEEYGEVYKGESKEIKLIKEGQYRRFRSNNFDGVYVEY